MKNWAGLAVLTLYLTGNLSIDTSFHMKFKHWHLLWRGIWAGYTVLRSGGCGLVFSWSSLFWQWQHPLDTVGPGTLSLWWLCSPPATKVIHQIIQYTLYMGYHVNVKLSLFSVITEIKKSKLTQFSWTEYPSLWFNMQPPFYSTCAANIELLMSNTIKWSSNTYCFLHLNLVYLDTTEFVFKSTVEQEFVSILNILALKTQRCHPQTLEVYIDM